MTSISCRLSFIGPQKNLFSSTKKKKHCLPAFNAIFFNVRWRQVDNRIVNNLQKHWQNDILPFRSSHIKEPLRWVALFSVYQNKSEFDKNTNMLEDARHSFFLLRQLSWLLLFWKLVTSLEDVNERKWKCQSQLSWQIFFLFLSSFVILKKVISFSSFIEQFMKPILLTLGKIPQIHKVQSIEPVPSVFLISFGLILMYLVTLLIDQG